MAGAGQKQQKNRVARDVRSWFPAMTKARRSAPFMNYS